MKRVLGAEDRVKRIEYLIDDRPDAGVFVVDRDAFRDPDIFDLEMKFIFERTWNFVGLESQIPNPNDFLTTWVGRAPVILSRDNRGDVGAFINSCRHKGATLCTMQSGNRRLHVCPYHSWSYDSGGNNVAIKGRDEGAYSDAFLAQDHNLQRLPRLESYRGFVFASLNPSVAPLREHLGDAATFIDLVVDQSPDGIEIVPGSMRFTFDGNWKMQLENCTDGYHFTSTHASLLRVLDRRAQSQRAEQAGSIFEGEKFWEQREGAGSFSFLGGHVLGWGDQPPQPTHPLYPRYDEVSARAGAAKARWMFNVRNLSIFPNLQLADNASIQLRVMRPLAVNRTEMTTYCIAPRGEPAAQRGMRIRQYEEFFNPSGLATPDDAAVYERCQVGFGARSLSDSQGYARGMTATRAGGDHFAEQLGVRPLRSSFGPFEMSDETIFHNLYRHWRDMLLEGARADGVQ